MVVLSTFVIRLWNWIHLNTKQSSLEKLVDVVKASVCYLMTDNDSGSMRTSLWFQVSITIS